jgi:hypothetical protein
MKAKKKDPIVSGGILDEVTITPYTKNKYAFEDRMNKKATGKAESVYPIADILMGVGLGSVAKKMAKKKVKKAIAGFGKDKVRKAPIKQRIKSLGIRAGLFANDASSVYNNNK